MDVGGAVLHRRHLLARLTSQLLAGPRAGTSEQVVERLLAVQAQDLRGARLSVRARSSGLSTADVDDALARRSLVVSWLNRGTLHLVTPADYRLLHPLTTPQLATSNLRRLRQEGVSPEEAERGVRVVADATGEGPLTRGELKARLDAAGVPTARQALVHVLFAATLRGLLVRGPVRDGEQSFVAADDWLGPPPEPLERGEALGRLARRYLAGHGPAGPRDLAVWAGVGLGDARRGLAVLGDEVVEVAPGLLALAAQPPAARMPGPQLLGPFDPLLLGWASRAPYVGIHGSVVTSNGVFRPFALVDGTVVGTWGLAAGVVGLHLLEPVPDAVVRRLDAEAADVLRYLGLPPHPLVVTPHTK